MSRETERHRDTCNAADRNPKKLSGARVFKDTGLTLATLYEHLADGVNRSELFGDRLAWVVLPLPGWRAA